MGPFSEIGSEEQRNKVWWLVSFRNLGCLFVLVSLSKIWASIVSIYIYNLFSIIAFLSTGIMFFFYIKQTEDVQVHSWLPQYIHKHQRNSFAFFIPRLKWKSENNIYDQFLFSVFIHGTRSLLFTLCAAEMGLLHILEPF